MVVQKIQDVGTNNDEAIVLFNGNATDDFDAYDSHKMSNGNKDIPEIYTFAGNEQVVINGLSNLTTTREMPLGFTTGATNSFTIKATEVSNFDADTKIILKDNVSNVEKDLTDGSDYTFTSDATTTASRFTVIFKTTSIATDVNNKNEDFSAINVFKNANNQITVNCSVGMVGQGILSVYNAVGQKLETKSLTSTTTILNNLNHPGVYFVSVMTNGKITTRKVVIN